MFGVTIGAPFNGVLADRYGRKMTVAVGFVAYSALAIGSCWIPNLSALLLSRFLMGAVHPTIQKTGYILGMEVADPKWRTHIGIVLFLPWALGLMAWGGFAYLVREWRMLQLTVSLLCLAFLPTLWFMDESPRWLAVRGSTGAPSECCRGPPGGTGSPCPRGRASAPAQGRSQGRGNGTPAPRRPRPHRERLVQKAFG
ncbi:putative organic cation transporter protein-like isoform X1 [Penaeus vannamei]|uniref:Putative organic cation transporter protein-like isoform X1 n=1 Tax=Penaeus vannamei TaxID=6689 RepID=A0A3R7N1Q4_PENVA|nr:putative organic cation transporter protein-like isoform X1 [Penaeus vannamei]